MNIQQYHKPGISRNCKLVNTSIDEINAKLGFPPNVDDDPYKVPYSWSFTVDGRESYFGIWSYRNSHNYGQFSCYGDMSVFIELFGPERVIT